MIILEKWICHLALPESLWITFTSYFSTLAQPVSSYNASRNFASRFSLTFPQGTSRLVRPDYLGVGSPLLLGFQLTVADLRGCSMNLIDLFLRCEISSIISITSDVDRREAFINLEDHNGLGIFFGRWWYKVT